MIYCSDETLGITPRLRRHSHITICFYRVALRQDSIKLKPHFLRPHGSASAAQSDHDLHETSECQDI